MQKRATIKDVAREAHVSIKTVSNVINDSGSMRPQTRKRVEQAIDSLGYSINMSARLLKTGESRLLGLATFDFAQPFPATFVDAVVKAARKRQYGVVVDTYDSDGEGLSTILKEIPQLGADGWVFLMDRPAHPKSILDQNYPLVLAGDYLSYGKVDSVMMPNVDAVKAVVGRLLDGGVERIGLIGAPDGADRQLVFEAQEGGRPMRTRGYIEAFEERGMRVDWRIMVSGNKWISSDGERAVSTMLANADLPEAIVCLNDALAFGTMHELQRRGFSIPEDVQIVGFDNVAEGRYSNPALTTIDPNTGDFAQRAVDMVIERIEGYQGPARMCTTDFRLIERASTWFER
ncbi:LacI-type transcriptional regulator [Bifidobacterium actinocoloniiforme DSM 22766]|uniref:LacI-type transcriptional regulator n=1 Tax=Bifidobacterium actinocoloniiforme DSM 22766 TaxID=1437605 RepID=A0A086Z2Q1_9BIFI|nr:LacI family DNA-binding transcriptional regulator [Bifidobacterium actinocoloniiforme]AKV55768.1 LacI family transcriptional regulator [Bifidobacterium actinocoloniiforme DSM 22766]KFI40801.1 LacI-type transcriptional regulator [Bifidobacterium actinocoloniiforme DSM 22766]